MVYTRTKDGFVLRWTELRSGAAAVGQPNMRLSDLEFYEFRMMERNEETRREHHGAVLEIKPK